MVLVGTGIEEIMTSLHLKKQDLDATSMPRKFRMEAKKNRVKAKMCPRIPLSAIVSGCSSKMQVLFVFGKTLKQKVSTK